MNKLLISILLLSGCRTRPFTTHQTTALSVGCYRLSIAEYESPRTERSWDEIKAENDLCQERANKEYVRAIKEWRKTQRKPNDEARTK